MTHVSKIAIETASTNTTPDARLVEAWRRSCELEATINALPAWDEETSDRLADEFGDCHVLIAETPCHDSTGIAAKLHVLKWLRDNGSTAEWEDVLIETAIAALEEVSSNARL